MFYFFISILILMILFLINRRKTYPLIIREGFGYTEKTEKRNIEDIYDPFYSEIYDELFKSEVKNEFECMFIHKDYLKPYQGKVNVLDLGCGTGEHMRILSRYGHNIEGIDLSKYMVKQAKKKTDKKNVNYKIADFHTANIYKTREFSHILCLFHTIYYSPNLTQLFKNCNRWLLPDGALFIHTINRKRFDPILESSSSLIPFFDPQRHVDKRVTRTELFFNKFRYEANWNFGKKKTIFKEIFEFSDKPILRENSHVFHIYPQKKIVEMAKKYGFKLSKVIDQQVIGYHYNYILCFQKKYGL